MLLLLLSHFSHVWLFSTLWTITFEAPLSMGFSRQQYWGGLPFPSPEDLPNTGIKLKSLALQADSLPSELPGKPESWSQNYLENGRSGSLVHDLSAAAGCFSALLNKVDPIQGHLVDLSLSSEARGAPELIIQAYSQATCICWPKNQKLGLRCMSLGLGVEYLLITCELIKNV